MIQSSLPDLQFDRKDYLYHELTVISCKQYRFRFEGVRCDRVFCRWRLAARMFPEKHKLKEQMGFFYSFQKQFGSMSELEGKVYE